MFFKNAYEIIPKLASKILCYTKLIYRTIKKLKRTYNVNPNDLIQIWMFLPL